jgi:hypothetical protein
MLVKRTRLVQGLERDIRGEQITPLLLVVTAVEIAQGVSAPPFLLDGFLKATTEK